MRHPILFFGAVVILSTISREGELRPLAPANPNAREAIWLLTIVLSQSLLALSRVRRKLEAINAASRLDDLKVPPANRLEKLKGNLKDFYSIRINDQWRVIFRWVDGEAHDVQIVD